MKNLLESFAVFLVGALSLLIIFLIVQYNLIKDDNIIEDIAYTPVKSKSKQETTKDYLSDMEKYADVDVNVDPTKEDNTNSVVVTSELVRNVLKDTVEDKSKSSYTKNLTEYSKKKEEPVKSEKPLPEEETTEEAEKKTQDGMGDQSQMKAIEEMGNALDSIVGDEDEPASSAHPKKPTETIDDEIGQAIDAALDDL